MNDNREYNLPKNIDIYSDEFIRDISILPAVENVGRDVYILKNNAILCVASVGSSYNERVIVYLNNEEALEIFKDDSFVKSSGYHAPFSFLMHTGWYDFGRFADEPEDRGVGLTIVDKNAFDWGFASKMRYSHIPGFGEK